MKELKNHIKAKHEGVYYSCDQCSHTVSTRVYLKIHIKAKHEGVYYICDQCSYKSSYTCDLKKHILFVEIPG